MNDNIPLKDVTLQQLVTCDAKAFRVFVDLLKANRAIRAKMSEGADHLMRRVFFCPSKKAFRYDPGDEPPMTMVPEFKMN